jgi:hypothetical protein
MRLLTCTARTAFGASVAIGPARARTAIKQNLRCLMAVQVLFKSYPLAPPDVKPYLFREAEVCLVDRAIGQLHS